MTERGPGFGQQQLMLTVAAGAFFNKAFHIVIGWPIQDVVGATDLHQHAIA
jgi:hypothetical protein